MLGLASFIIEPMCRKATPRLVWAFSNFVVSLGMAAICITSVWSLNKFTQGTIQQAISADTDVKVVALVIFAALGLPLAVSSSFYSISPIFCSCELFLEHYLVFVLFFSLAGSV